MTSTLKYKGYTGTIEIDTDSECLCGQVLFIRGLIVYEADTLPELRQNFESAVDTYLASCAADGTSPEKPASGTFNVRIDLNSMPQPSSPRTMLTSHSTSG